MRIRLLSDADLHVKRCRFACQAKKVSPCRLHNPWGATFVRLTRNGKPAETLSGALLTFKTSANEVIDLAAQ
jgi:hypothetical protein